MTINYCSYGCTHQSKRHTRIAFCFFPFFELCKDDALVRKQEYTRISADIGGKVEGRD